MARPVDTGRKLTQQVVNSSNITHQHNVLVQTAFSVILFSFSPGDALDCNLFTGREVEMLEINLFDNSNSVP